MTSAMGVGQREGRGRGGGGSDASESGCGSVSEQTEFAETSWGCSGIVCGKTKITNFEMVSATLPEFLVNLQKMSGFAAVLPDFLGFVTPPRRRQCELTWCMCVCVSERGEGVW